MSPISRRPSPTCLMRALTLNVLFMQVHSLQHAYDNLEHPLETLSHTSSALSGFLTPTKSTGYHLNNWRLQNSYPCNVDDQSYSSSQPQAHTIETTITIALPSLRHKTPRCFEVKRCSMERVNTVAQSDVWASNSTVPGTDKQPPSMLRLTTATMSGLFENNCPISLRRKYLCANTTWIPPDVVRWVRDFA